MSSLQVLVIDDEPAIRQVLASHIRKGGHQVEHVGSGTAALERLELGDIDVALCDIRMPDVDGIEVVRKACATGIDTVFIMMTAFASVDTAIEAMKAGAFEYLTKPVRPEDVLHRLEQVDNMIRLKDENARLRDMVSEQNGGLYFSLPSRAMQKAEVLIAKIAATRGTVLITGDSGTGKSVVARRIHQQSGCSEGPFVQVNSGAIPENLLESELFGHVKGAFTGADRTKKGLFREADGGTLFLDEIGELPLALQVKLLHALEENAVRPVGSEQHRPVNVRIITATNCNLEEQVRQGKFREDLYYRINVLHMHLPALRERAEDILPLARYFIEHEARQLGLDQNYETEPEFDEILTAYAWPGNVRELKNVIQRMLLLTENNVLSVDDMPYRFREKTAASGVRTHDKATLREQVRSFETGLIQQAIKDAGGDRLTAAKRLGIGISTLYRKLEENQENEPAASA